ncbi:scarecrow-like protein 6 [Silene latifolia]|uniref:scarecrow-like protein 6 n=1 Tax=Silene latifolia TaxID=37657 RepID=UPI003D787773
MMQTMPYKFQQNGVLEVTQFPPNWNSLNKFPPQQQQQQQQQQLQVYSNNCEKNSSNNNNNSCSRTTSCVESEPTSALDTIRGRSPSPPTSASTLSSSFTGGAGGVADPVCLNGGSDNVAGGGAGDGDGGNGIGLEEWDSLFPNGDGALLPWIMGDPDDPGLGNAGLGVVDQVCFNNAFNSNPTQLHSANSGIGSFTTPFNVGGAEKPVILNPQLLLNQQQVQTVSNPSFVMSPTMLGNNNNNNYCQQFEQFQPQLKRHNPGLMMMGGLTQIPMGLPPELFAGQKPVMRAKGQEEGVKDQLFKAADLIQTGNFSLAQEILARLNQQLSIQGKPPIIRAALYLKEALQMLLQLSNPVTVPPPKTLTPYDIVHKMNAYKVFSEVSPITQFVNFTCTQAILEALDDVDVIHVVDFDIGCGAQWASLIQELPLRKKGAPSLRITTVVPSTTHPFELALVRENLVQFAIDIGIAFDFQIVNLDSFDPSLSSFPNFSSTSENECFAVHIPIWASSTRPSVLPSILRFIKQQSPKIVVSFDRGFDRCDLPFPQHLIHSLESCINLLESLDGLNVASDVVSKVEKFFVQPGIENSVLGRLHAPDKMPHWKNLFASVGFVPLQFSNFTETQADYVVKRTPGRGFHVEKRQASLVLSWQRRELVAASAWRC